MSTKQKITSLTIQGADAGDVVGVELHVWLVASVVGVHDGVLVVGVAQAERVAELVRGDPQQVRAA